MNNQESVTGYTRNPILTIGIGEKSARTLNILKNSGRGLVDYFALNTEKLINDAFSVKTRMEEVLFNHHKLIIMVVGYDDQKAIKEALVVAEVAKMFALQIIGVVLVPLSFEDFQKSYQDTESLDTLMKNIDLLIVIPNNYLIRVDGKTTSTESYGQADHLVISAVSCITSIGTGTGILNIPFADLLSMTRNKGIGFVIEGAASGENRGVNAAANAFSSQLTIPQIISKAKYLIIYIVSKSDDITINELGEMLDFLTTIVDENCEFLWNVFNDGEIDEEIKITIMGIEFDDPLVLSILQN